MMNPPPGRPEDAPGQQTAPGMPGAYPDSDAQPQPRMVPVHRPATRPIVVYTILVVTILVYLLQELTRMGIGREPFLALSQAIFGQDLLQALLNNGWDSDLLTLLGGKINPLIEAGQYWRLFTPALLHASLMHIGFNMYALFAIGPSLESYYGHGRFLGLYLLGALGGNVLSFLLSPGLSVGASTAIFGLIGAEAMFIYLNRAIFGPQARSMLSNVVVIIVINLVLGLSPGIDNFGHLGGLLAGLIFGWFAGPRLQVEYNYPNYELKDQRSPAMAWLVGFVLAAILLGLVFLRIIQSA